MFIFAVRDEERFPCIQICSPALDCSTTMSQLHGIPCTLKNPAKHSYIFWFLEHMKHWEFMHRVRNIVAFGHSKPNSRGKMPKMPENWNYCHGFYLCFFALGMFTWQQKKRKCGEKILLSRYQWKLGTNRNQKPACFWEISRQSPDLPKLNCLNLEVFPQHIPNP